MNSIFKKEIKSFFYGLTGYIAVVAFLLANGCYLFIFNNNVFDDGISSLEKFFDFAPWVLMFLIPAITMRSFSDEIKNGNFELLITKPISNWQIIGAKFLGNFTVSVIAILPTIVYAICIINLSNKSSLDVGTLLCSYIGLILLSLAFSAIGIFCSANSSNGIIAFISSTVLCFLIYYGFNKLSKLPFFANGTDYYLELLGIDFHYKNLNRGVISFSNLIYFVSVSSLFFFFTNLKISETK